MIVHQVLAGAGPHDAVTTQARAYRDRFRRWGWGGADYASFIEPGLNGAVRPRADLSPAPDDLILVHHSAVTPQLDELVALTNRKLLVYHNVTPAAWLWEVAPVLAAHCAVGRDQLPQLVAGVEVCAGVSAFNAAELEAAGARSPHVVPLLLELDRLGSATPGMGGPRATPDAAFAPVILFVGRLSPHKRQDEVIRAFALYRGRHAPRARLNLVGAAITPGYGELLRALADTLAPGAVEFENGLSDAELGERYRRASALLCLSEHEGFCLPLIEAMRFGVPVVARAAGAVPETVSGAALLLGDGDDLAVAAEALQLAVSDVELRSELARRAAARVEAYAPDATAAKLRSVVEATAQYGLKPSPV